MDPTQETNETTNEPHVIQYHDVLNVNAPYEEEEEEDVQESNEAKSQDVFVVDPSEHHTIVSVVILPSRMELTYVIKTRDLPANFIPKEKWYQNNVVSYLKDDDLYDEEVTSYIESVGVCLGQQGHEKEHEFWETLKDVKTNYTRFIVLCNKKQKTK